MSQSLTVSVAVGNFVQEVGTIRLESSTSTGGINLKLLFLLISVFTIFVLVAFACGTLIGCAMIKMKGTRYAIIIVKTFSISNSNFAEP